MNNPMSYVPSVIEKSDSGITTYDLYSKLMADRIIVLGEQVHHVSAMNTVAMLLYLDAKDKNKPINIYINSPGGSIIDGLAVVDTMKLIRAPVHTIACGMAASMGAVILSCGDRRKALPHSDIMIHQAAGGTQGKTADVEIALKHMKRLQDTLYAMLAKNCNKTVEEIDAAADRDNWMTPEEALEFGLIDEIITEEQK